MDHSGELTVRRFRNGTERSRRSRCPVSSYARPARREHVRRVAGGRLSLSASCFYSTDNKSEHEGHEEKTERAVSLEFICTRLPKENSPAVFLTLFFAIVTFVFALGFL